MGACAAMTGRAIHAWMFVISSLVLLYFILTFRYQRETYFFYFPPPKTREDTDLTNVVAVIQDMISGESCFWNTMLLVWLPPIAHLLMLIGLLCQLRVPVIIAIILFSGLALFNGWSTVQLALDPDQCVEDMNYTLVHSYVKHSNEWYRGKDMRPFRSAILRVQLDDNCCQSQLWEELSVTTQLSINDVGYTYPLSCCVEVTDHSLKLENDFDLQMLRLRSFLNNGNSEPDVARTCRETGPNYAGNPRQDTDEDVEGGIWKEDCTEALSGLYRNALYRLFATFLVLFVIHLISAILGCLAVPLATRVTARYFVYESDSDCDVRLDDEAMK